MTRKCFSCGATKGLKAIQLQECDCGKCDGFHNSSTCKSCYFSDMISCEMDCHSVDDCLKDATCENHKETLDRFTNWNNLNYHYKPKMTLSNISSQRRES